MDNLHTNFDLGKKYKIFHLSIKGCFKLSKIAKFSCETL